MQTQERQREYFLNRYHERRIKAIELLGGKCSHCGSIEDLEFDHIDPSTKEFPVSKDWGRTWHKIEKELAKCQLLCSSCHKKKTEKEINERREHGTWGMYNTGCRCSKCRERINEYSRNYKRRRRIKA